MRNPSATKKGPGRVHRYGYSKGNKKYRNKLAKLRARRGK